MAGSSIGTIFRVTTAGESHGPGYAVIVDGVPAGLDLSPADIQRDLDRRRPGQSEVTTARDESDQAEILSGVFEGKTTGAPVAILVRNKDQRSRDYSEIKNKFRPGHADFTYQAKYGIRDHRGGGRSSARETLTRVAAGAIAKKLLAGSAMKVIAYTRQVGPISLEQVNIHSIDQEQVEASLVRCPDPQTSEKMIELISQVKSEGDSVGGVAEIVVSNPLPGLGEPVFDKLKADLGKALFSIPAVTGVEFGAGFQAAQMRGSEHNDEFIAKGKSTVTKTNRHGGILGGLSSGMPIVIRCAVKPTSSIGKPQSTVDTQNRETNILVEGRHDPCLLPRFVPVAEAMVAIVLADHILRQQASRVQSF